MLIFDPSNYTKIALVPRVSGAVIQPGFEAITGADFMVSPIRAPADTLARTQNHLRHGAQLVQVKMGGDLCTSVGDRLNESLSRMQSIGAKREQCVLLFVGRLQRGRDGEALINGRHATYGASYWAVRTALASWGHRGGLPLELDDARDFEEWCSRTEIRLVEYKSNPVYHIYPVLDQLPGRPDPGDGLQVLVRPSQDKRTLAWLIGPALVEPVLAHCGSVADAIAYVTDRASGKGKGAHRVVGLGPGIIDKARGKLGMDDRATRMQSVED